VHEWEEKRLGEVTNNIFSGGTPSTSIDTYWNGEHYWLSSGETKNRYIYTTEKTITDEGVKNSSTRLSKCNDIVMACAGQGGTRGQTSLIKKDMYINQSIIAIRVNKKFLVPEYLFYNLSNRYDELRLISDASSTRGSITTEMLKSLPINVPPLSIQQKIANILSYYDELIENNNRRIEILEKTAQDMYREWFVRFRFPNYKQTKFENGLPHGWKEVKLGDISEFTYGKMPKKDQIREHGFPIFSGYRIVGYYDEFMYENEMLIIVARGVGGTGDVKFAPPKSFITNLSIIFLLKDNDLTANYLFQMFNNNSLRYLDTGAAQSQITIDNLKRVKIMLPSKDLLNKYYYHANIIRTQIKNLQTQNQNLIKQRDLLLPRLMSGKLEV